MSGIRKPTQSRQRYNNISVPLYCPNLIEIHFEKRRADCFRLECGEARFRNLIMLYKGPGGSSTKYTMLCDVGKKNIFPTSFKQHFQNYSPYDSFLLFSSRDPKITGKNYIRTTIFMTGDERGRLSIVSDTMSAARNSETIQVSGS